MRRFSAALASGWLVVASVSGAGCAPRCSQTCNKLLQCGDQLGDMHTERIAHAECEEACRRQGAQFQDWDDADELQDAWDDHRRCIRSSTCEEIADGECYDERLFSLDPDE